MARFYLFFLLLIPISSWAENPVAKAISESIDDIKDSLEHISNSYQQCEVLYEEMRESDCANAVFGMFGRIYLKLGVSFTERQLKFQSAKSKKDAFVLSSGSKPRPIYGVALSDSYFADSNWGYGFGFDYFDDYAFEQIIKRSNQDVSYDMGTYSSMSVISVSPSLFYTWGRGDDTPHRYGKLGLGVNLMYSSVKGNAYETELDTTENSVCYDAATEVFNDNTIDPTSIGSSCQLQRFKESSYGTGFKLFVIGGWKKWEAELSISEYQHRGDGEYRFITQQILLGLSRKFSF
jgi:hypothetical protein